MRDRENPPDRLAPDTDDGTLELQDSGQSLEEALAEEERSAILAAEEKLRSVEKDLEELKDRHLRKLAEFDNIRKRTEREKREHFRSALMDLARDFLPILDNLERAMAHASPEERKSNFGQGIGLIRRQLMDLWRRYGLEEVETTGPFDPNRHEAVATQATKEIVPNSIVEVLQKGYVLNDRLVRPAAVKVSVRERESAVENPDETS
ncbi:MAG TPA: nucleotide exchange factor GrpE [Thermoanaerobaculia bacterium]|nr:nucleotide exchange factor GrpE [Thermoanaerobaculia bacterium]